MNVGFLIELLVINDDRPVRNCHFLIDFSEHGGQKFIIDFCESVKIKGFI